MRLSWNEVRARAAAFADEWRDAAYEKGETQSFYNAFFYFGVTTLNVCPNDYHEINLPPSRRTLLPAFLRRDFVSYTD